MGRKAKGKRAEEKKQQKKAAKMERRTKYEGFAKLGKLKGTKRFRAKSKSTLTPSIKHPMENCGNPGCGRCRPLLVGHNMSDHFPAEIQIGGRVPKKLLEGLVESLSYDGVRTVANKS